MNCKTFFFSFCGTVLWSAVTIAAFGQVPVESIGHGRLKAYTTVRPHAGPVVGSNSKGSPMLPLWTFDVSSTRDHNNYSGVMVGHNPFTHGETARVPTQIVPIVITTNLIGTSVDSSGNVTTTPGVTAFDPTVPNTACLVSPNDVPLTLYRESPIIHAAKFEFGGTTVGDTQYVDAFQRANFWSVKDPDYHVLLDPVTTIQTVYINVPAADGLALEDCPWPAGLLRQAGDHRHQLV